MPSKKGAVEAEQSLGGRTQGDMVPAEQAIYLWDDAVQTVTLWA
jgi:hypothetical protein